MTKRGQVSFIIIGVVVLVVLLAALGLAVRDSDSGAGSAPQADAFIVRRGDFDVSIPVSGELAALKQIEIRNKVEGRSVITEIVPEGIFANKGDVLLRLNDDEIRSKLRDAQDKANIAEAALIAAEAELAITLKTRDAELAKADLAVMLADLALKSWQEGESVSKRQELELALETAEKEFARLEARFKESAGLLDKKFISLDEYKRDEIAMIEARARLKQAQLDIQVYEKYQFMQDQAQKASDLDQARSERERVEQQYDAEVRTAQSEVDSKKFQLESAREKLAELRQQHENCVVHAPSSGLVVYYSSLDSGNRRNDGAPPMVGTEVSANEPIMILPDTSQMVATVKVSEALSGLIKTGQRASVISDAVPDRPLRGEVISIGVLAESGGWRDPNRREYSVKILLQEGAELGLKPAMRCKAEVYVGRVSNAVHVPIQAVLRNGPVTYAYVPQGRGFAQRKVSVGRASELYIEIIDGLSEGEVVLLREPPLSDVVSILPVPKRQRDEAPEEISEAPADAIVPADDEPASLTPDAGGERTGGPRPGMGGGSRGPGSTRDGRGGGGERGNRGRSATETSPDRTGDAGGSPAENRDGGAESSSSDSAPAATSGSLD